MVGELERAWVQLLAEQQVALLAAARTNPVHTMLGWFQQHANHLDSHPVFQRMPADP
jgi:hypothetical protein